MKPNPEQSPESAYGAQRTTIVAQTPNLRVAEFVLAPGESLPWHYHSEVDDTFYCLEGLLGVDIRDPSQRLVLRPGEKCVVRAKTVHHASNAADGVSRYLLVQGLGKYDFVRVD